MDALLAIVSPLNRGRRYGAASAALLLVLVLAEIEGLAFLVLAFGLGDPGLFLSLQPALMPAGLFVSAATALAVLWRASRWEFRRKLEAIESAELAASFVASNWQQRIGLSHPR